MITICPATHKESNIAIELFIQMWDSHEFEELQKVLETTFSSDRAAIFIAYMEKTPIGVAQTALRNDYVEGTDSTPVGYLEGIYVEKDYRNQGVAKALCKACESWAKEKGCTEFASDCELSNDASYKFHLNMGFIEANRIICFKKDLD